MGRVQRAATRHEWVQGIIVWALLIAAALGVMAAVWPFAMITTTGDYPGIAVARVEEDHPLVIVALWAHNLIV